MILLIDGFKDSNKNCQCITRYIKNRADSAEIELRSLHLTLCSLTGNRSEMPNFSYTKRYPPFGTLKAHSLQS